MGFCGVRLLWTLAGGRSCVDFTEVCPTGGPGRPIGPTVGAVSPGDVERWLPLVAVSAATVPAALLAVTVLQALRRRRGVPAGPGRRRSLSEVGMVAGTLPWICLTLTPVAAPGGVRLVPLRDLRDQLAAPATAAVQITGNLLVLAAFGFCAAARWRIGTPVVALLAAAGSLTIEVLQYALAPGRVSSVDDVLLNTAGATVAAWVSRRCLHAADRSRP
jgi:hypothetical protein